MGTGQLIMRDIIHLASNARETLVDIAEQVWADFVHATDESVMLIEGEIELRFAGQVLRPAVGEEVLIPATTPHTVVNVVTTRNRWLYGYAKR